MNTISALIPPPFLCSLNIALVGVPHANTWWNTLYYKLKKKWMQNWQAKARLPAGLEEAFFSLPSSTPPSPEPPPHRGNTVHDS